MNEPEHEDTCSLQQHGRSNKARNVMGQMWIERPLSAVMHKFD